MSVYALKRRRLLIYYLEITPFRKGNLLSELCLNVHSETHRFALGSQILIDCLLLDVIHKYRYSNHLDYNAYHTWLHTSVKLLNLRSHLLLKYKFSWAPLQPRKSTYLQKCITTKIGWKNFLVFFFRPLACWTKQKNNEESNSEHGGGISMLNMAI